MYSQAAPSLPHSFRVTPHVSQLLSLLCLTSFTFFTTLLKCTDTQPKMDHANRGEAALAASNYSEAISHYTSAIQQSPEAATYYLKRSMAYQRNSTYVSALHDAERAVILAVKRAKRELIAQAQLRRGIALYHLGNYGDADYCFGLAKKLNDKEKSTQMWQDKAQMKMKELDENDEKRKVNVKEVPDLATLEKTESTQSKSKEETSKDTATPAKTSANSTSTTQASTNPPSAPQPAQTLNQIPPSKIRHEWYQNNTHVYITILAKGVPKDLATIVIEPASVSISFPTATGSTYDFSLDPLYAKVDAAASTSRVLATKLEVVLKKEAAGQKWSALEGIAAPSGQNGDHKAADDHVHSAVLSASATSNGASAGVPSPYASRGGAKNWDNIAKTSLRAANAQAQAMSSSSGDAADSADPKKPQKKESEAYLDDEDDDGDDVNKFFKHLFKNADPDTRKAMVKSYTESGGTALSTNWEEVSKKRVEVSPPDGMEAKTWEG